MVTARRVLRAVLVALAVLVATSTAGPARAQTGTDLTATQAADLAAEAVTSDEALAQLRGVETVDGRPVDFEAVTSGLDTEGASRAERLEALAVELGGVGSGGEEITADQARVEAEAVLDQDKFSPTDVPRPFRGVLEWTAERLEGVGRFLDTLFGPVVRLFDRLPGGRFILLALLLGATGGIVWWLAQRRASTAVTRAQARGLVDLGSDPDHLEVEAEAAERAGDRAEAVRLRFEAGLLRLHRTGRITLRPDTTAADAAAQVDEPQMYDLTDAFEEIVYGGREATPEDLERSRTAWPPLVAAGART